MELNQITFGVEIETTIPFGAIPVGRRHNGVPVAAIPGWTAESDGSIRAGRGSMGCEFVSGVLKGEEGFESVLAAVAAIKAMGGKVNQSCGLHIHVGFDRNNTEGLNRLITIVANHEKAVYASTGTKRRERGIYCQSTQTLGSAVAAFGNGRGGDRYRMLNLTNLLTPGEKPTVEFRAFAGTLNPDKILGAIAMCLGLVQKSLETKRTGKWTAKPVVATSPIHRNGEGQTALTRLFYYLGWTKGRTAKVYGHIVADPRRVARIKRMLMKLARKYDAQ